MHATDPHGVVLFARIAPMKPDQPTELERAQSIEASGPTYDAAMAALRALMPEGSCLLSIARWPL